MLHYDGDIDDYVISHISLQLPVATTRGIRQSRYKQLHAVECRHAYPEDMIMIQ